MKNEMFNELLESVKQAGQIRNGEMEPSRRSVINIDSDPDRIIARARKLKQQAKGSLTIQEIQQAIDRGRL